MASTNLPPESESPTPRPGARLIPIHPFFIAAFPILSLYANNLNDVRLQAIWRPLGYSVLAACALWAIVGAASRHARKGAIVASLLVLSFFSYGHVANLLASAAAGVRAAGLLVLVAGVLTAVVMILRSRRAFRQATSVLNLASLVLVVPSCITVFTAILHARQMDESARIEARAELAAHTVSHAPIKPLTPAEAAALPDIYYIILDAYAGADSLQRYHHFDNSAFLSALEQRGFWIARRSRSNYHQTWFSLPSSLNMRYLGVVPTDPRGGINVYEALRRQIDGNEVAQFLRGRGYHYVYLWTGTEQTRVDTADLRLDDPSVTAPASFERQALGLSALSASSAARVADFDRHRKLVETGFERLATVPSLPYPKFVFAHFSVPHPPFVFGAQGEPLNPGGRYTEEDGSELLRTINREQYTRGYVAQLQYVNRRILQTVDAILKQSRRPPIILLQGDHGSRMNVAWDSLEKTDLGEPYSILNAYLVPPSVRSRLYEGITPVNSFRVLLSSMFDARLPLLPDRNYFSLPQNPLDFVEVTGRVPK